jgi:alcohol dehydrogenase class IV
VTFGRGALAEAGERARRLGMKRVALFTDARLCATSHFERLAASLAASGLDAAVYDATRVEPTDASFLDAARFAREAKVDGYVSLGGGSVIDTCKAANLYATHPAELSTYVNAPLGAGRPIPGPLAPHIACPTTSGTGSEVTGIAIFDLLSSETKTGFASPLLRPTEALVDPDTTATLPRNVVAASGFDVLSHALESFTARRFVDRKRPASPIARPMSQGANPWSDLGCREALSLLGSFLVRAVDDDADGEARENVMWAATLAGIAFGNAGVHVPHAMSYAVAGLVRSFHPEGWPGDEPIVPHGMAVIVNAPAVFRRTFATSPERHLEAARLLAADARGASPAGGNGADASAILSDRILELMRRAGVPVGLSAVGYRSADVGALVERTIAQERLLATAPLAATADVVADHFRSALAGG